MNYYIFGDSFGENNGDIDWLWYHRIDGKVINDSLGCTGVKRNLIQLESARPVDSNIIFLLTHKHRLIWPFIKHRDHNEDCYHLAADDGDPYPEYLLEYEKEIRVVYDMFGDDIEKSLFNTILYLYYWSKKHNCKTLILNCDDPGTNKFEDEYYFFNCETFKVHRSNIWDVSMKEFDNGIVDVEIERYNHLSKENHEVVYNIVSNFFSHTNHSETFIKDLYPGGEEFSRYVYE
jgi:hypothetical protein